MDSESVVRSCKVAPPASLIDKLFPPKVGSAVGHKESVVQVQTAADQYPLASGAEAVAATLPVQRASDTEEVTRRLISHLLNLAASITGGVWTPVADKDKELVLQIIAISADLIQVHFTISLFLAVTKNIFLLYFRISKSLGFSLLF